MVTTISQANESNQSPEPKITLEEFLKLPETKPASEYIDGRIYQNPCQMGNIALCKVS
ncbi:MAG: hypothetical protein HC916_11505 [Coleofasciculaceae cyanobacterium SM2_1_6]|nr:hypothetical protein [Coleofasciculaceae cyanobacterium SM2_1_6]